MKSIFARASILGVGLSLMTFSSAASAGDDVDPVSDAPDGMDAVQRGVQSPARMLSARLVLAIDLSAEQVGEPISLAPNIYYGVSDKLQLGLLHDGPMGWQSRPGLGLCLTGTDGGCPRAYDNVGFDLMYGLAFAGPLHLSAHGTLYVESFDASRVVFAVGAAGKFHFVDNVALYFDPQVGVALSDRNVNDDQLYVPLELQFQVSAPTAFKLLSGFSGSLSALGDTLEVPVGLGVTHNLNEHIDVGARFSFDNLLGKQADGVGRADTRSLALMLMLRN